jgi:thymidylate kinase
VIRRSHGGSSLINGQGIGQATDGRHSEAVEPVIAAEMPNPPGGLLRQVLADLDDASVRWCLLRDSPEDRRTDGDVDLLVARADLPRAVTVLTRRQMAPLAAYGRGTHRFFLGLDRGTGSWLKLDIVTELAYGPHFVVRTGAEDDCLAARRREGAAWGLRPEDEFWALLFHCVLDKRAVAGQQAERLGRLARSASLDSPLVAAWPEQNALFAALLTAARAGDWSTVVQEGGRLDQPSRRTARGQTARRLAASVILRTIEQPLQAWSRRGVSVALLGPDGAGKSTLASAIQSSFYFPVRSIYMGLWARREAASSTPRVLLEIALRPFVVWRRYLESVRHRALGRLVVFDRYVYDAMLPPTGPLVWLKRPYFWLLSRMCPAPDLVLVLDVPGNVMHERKAEHDPERLEADREHFRRLLQRLPHAEPVDADRPADVVLTDVLSRIWRRYVDRGRLG